MPSGPRSSTPSCSAGRYPPTRRWADTRWSTRARARGRSAAGSGRHRTRRTPGSRSTCGSTTWTGTWTGRSSWAASGWCRRWTCPAISAGSRYSPTRTETGSDCGPEESAMSGGPQDGRADDEATDEALRALAEPRRRAILRLVARDELAAGEIAAAFEVTRTAISQHLTVLKNAGLLAERRDGTRRLYRARPEGLAGLRQFLDDMWADSLDTARRLVEAERGISEDDQAASAG